VKPQSSLRSLLVAAGSSLLALSSSHAATLYWDGTSATANADGGTGNWDNNNLTNWDTLALVGANSVWLNSTPDLAVFGGTAGTVSLTSAITTGGITFNTTGYTIQNNTLTFDGNTTVALNNVAAATINSAIGTSAANLTFSALNPFTAGTLTFGAAGGWTGTTTVNAGFTLQLNSASTALLNTSGITLNGGTIRQNYTTIGDRINNSAAITSYGGSLLTINPNTAGAFTETIGAITLQRGLTTFLHEQSPASLTSQTLTLTSLTRNGTSAVNFASNASLNTTKNIMTVTGATATTAGQIIGAWATVGNTAGAFDYAIYDGSSRIVGANMGGTGQASWTVSTDAYNNNVVTQTLGATRTIAALRNTAATATLTLATGVNLETYGVLNGATSLFTIAPGTGGVLLTPSGGGQLHLNAGNGTAGGAMTISAPINDNGTVILVKNGLGTLTLSSTTSNFSGGIILNAGSLNTEADTNLGNGGGVTVNGTVTWGMGAIATTYNRTLTLNDGAILTLTSGNNAKTVAGVLSGNGSLFANHSTDFIFNNAANTFQGAIQSATAGSNTYGLTFASIGDLAGAGLITLVGGSGTFHWSSASGSTTTLANRQFAISGTGSGVIVAKGATAASNLVINRDLLLTGAAGARTLTLDGSNTGNNTFAGLVANGTDGGASVVSLTKNGASLWILTGNNTYSGPTTVTSGTLVVSSSANLGDGSATNNLVFNGGTLRTDGAITWPSTRGVTMTGAGTINTNGNALTIGVIITGAGALMKTGASDLTLSNANTFTGTTTVSTGKVVMTHALALQNSSYTTTGSNGTTIGLDVTSGLSSGNLTLGGLAGAVNLASAFTAGFTGTVTQLTLNPQAGITNTYSAAIANGSMALIKTGLGTQVFASNNSYSGTTTITAGILNAQSSDRLGNNSATNTLIFNGGTLQSGAGGFVSPATRGVTMASTGIIDATNSANPVSIASNITGPGGLTKIGIGTLTVSGTNNFNGVTTVNAGTLVIANEAALASNTAARLNVKDRASLQLSVNAAGTNGFTAANLDTLLGNISVANTAAQGLQSGAGLIIDTTNAGGSFTQGNAFTDSTGAFGGIITLTKVGTGTLVLDKTNTYTGTTTISAGTLEVQGSIATSSNIINNATLLFNSGSALAYANPITGTGIISKSGAGTLTLAGNYTFSGSTTVNAGNLTLSNALVLRNSALVTTGAGTLTLSGVTSPTFGGLSGASGNLAAIITNYSTFTNLTLNPPTGVTHTYGGVIADGVLGLTLTKTSAGTHVLTGANLYTGATIINQGTLNLGGATATGSLASTVLTLNGGTLSYTRTGTNTQSFTTTNVTSGANQVSTSVATQTLELNNIVRSVGGTINFGNTGTITTTNTLSNGILGGWATTNNDNWATKTGSNITALGVYTGANATAATNLNTNMDAATVTIGGVINTNSIRFSGASAKTLTLATGDNIIQSGGILVRSDVAAFASSITGGNLAGSASGDLLVHQHNNNAAGALTIGSLIQNNTAATALTKSGAGNLILTNSSNTYTGGTFLNAGTLTYTNDGQLGLAGSRNITFGGAATLVGFSGSSLNTLTVNAGAVGTLSAQGYTFATTTGSGTLSYFPNATNSAVTNLGNASTYSGNIAALMGGNTNASPVLQFSAINDAADSAFQFGGNNTDSQQNVTIRYLGTAAMVFNNRSIELLAPSGGNNTAAFASVQNNSVSSAHTWTINTNFVMSTTQNRSLSLQGTNTGNNAFNGVIGNGLGTTNLRKADAGTWLLGSANTYTGSTSVTAGRLSLNNLNAVATTSSVTVSSGGTLSFPIVGTYNIPGTIAIAGNGATLPGGAGALWFGQGGSYTATLNAPVNVTAAAKIGSYGNTMSQVLGGQISGGTTAGTLALTIQSQGGNSAADVHTWTLNAASVYSGNTTFTESGGVLSNTLKLGITNALPTTTTLTLAPVTAGKNTRLDLNGQSQQLAGLLNTGTPAQAIVFNGGEGTPILRIDLAGSNTFSGNLGPGGTSFALTKNLAGDLTLSGTNTYTGDTTINNGRILVSAANHLSSGATSIVQSGTGQLLSTAGATFSNNFNISTTGYLEASDSQNNVDGAIRLDGTNTLSGSITLSGNARIGAVGATATNTISGKITGSFGIDFYGMNTASTQVHTFTLSNNTNDYTGATTVFNSNYNNTGYTGVETILRLGASNVIPNGASAGNVVFASNGTNPNNIVSLDLASFSDTINGLSVGAGANANITNSVAGDSTLTIGDNNTTSSFVGTITNTTGTLAITKIGSGTLTLSGANTYTGATNVNAGTLIVNGTLDTGAVTVGINGTFGGTGNVWGNTTISGIHSPGNSPGIQTFFGNLSYVNGGTPNPTVNWELASNTTTVGANPTANFDQIIVWGNLDFTHTTNLNLSFNGMGSTVLWSDSLWDSNQSWLLYDLTGLGSTTNIANLNLNTTNWLDSGSNLFSTAGGSFTLSQNGEDVMLNFAAVPEPSTYGIGLGAMALALAAVRRQRRKKS
jgi:autotransporter-associated beta strand protein